MPDKVVVDLPATWASCSWCGGDRWSVVLVRACAPARSARAARWVARFSTGRKRQATARNLRLHPSQPRYIGAAWSQACWERIGECPRLEVGQSSKAVRLRFVVLTVRGCSSWLVRTRCAFGSVRFEPVRWLRIAYPAGEPLPGWLTAQGAPGRQGARPISPAQARLPPPGWDWGVGWATHLAGSAISCEPGATACHRTVI